jgi:TatD DNase family protein
VKRGPDAPRVYCTAGVHPHHAKDLSTDTIDALRALAQRPEVRAIGECGLDFDRNFSPHDAQLHAFEAQLELASELALPVFLHERSAHEAFVAILEKWRPRISHAVVHCFTGTGAELDRYLQLDLHIGLTGWICDERRGKHLLDIVRRIPADRLMIETDAPYILPRTIPRHARPSDGRNEAAFLSWVRASVAAARGESESDLDAATEATSSAFFGLDMS